MKIKRKRKKKNNKKKLVAPPSYIALTNFFLKNFNKTQIILAHVALQNNNEKN